MGKIYLLPDMYSEGIKEIIIVPDKITIEYLVRDYLLKHCKLHFIRNSDRRGNINYQYFWIDPKDYEENRIQHLFEMGLYEWLESDLPPEAEFNIANVAVEDFCVYLESKGCLILEPEYIH